MPIWILHGCEYGRRVGASLGIFFICFVKDPKVAQMGVMLIVFFLIFFTVGTIMFTKSEQNR